MRAGAGCLISFLSLAALFALTVLLTGCAGYGAVKSGVASYGAKAADESRMAAEWTICNAISVGAWKRAYGANPEKADAWRRLCAEELTATP